MSKRGLYLKILSSVENGSFVKLLPDFSDDLINDPKLVRIAIYAIFKLKSEMPELAEEMKRVLLASEKNLKRTDGQGFLFGAKGYCTALHLALMDQQPREMIEDLLEFGFSADDVTSISDLEIGASPEKVIECRTRLEHMKNYFSEDATVAISRLPINARMLAMIFHRDDLLKGNLLHFENELPLISNMYRDCKNEVDMIFIREIVGNLDKSIVLNESKNARLEFRSSGIVSIARGNSISSRELELASLPILKFNDSTYSLSISRYRDHGYSSDFPNSPWWRENRVNIPEKYREFIVGLQTECKENSITKISLIPEFAELLDLLEERGLDEERICALNRGEQVTLLNVVNILPMKKQPQPKVGLSLFQKNNIPFVDLCFQKGILSRESRIQHDEVQYTPLVFALKFSSKEMAELVTLKMDQIQTSDLQLEFAEDITQYRPFFSMLFASGKLDKALDELVRADLETQEKEAAERERLAREREAKDHQMRIDLEARLARERVEPARERIERDAQLLRERLHGQTGQFNTIEPSQSNSLLVNFQYGSTDSSKVPLLNDQKKEKSKFSWKW